MNLIDFVPLYALEHDIEQSTLASYQMVARRLDRFGGGLKLTDLKRDLVNSFLVHLREEGRKKHTVACYRRTVLVLWRAAYDAELCDEAPRRIRVIRLPDTPKDVWTAVEVDRLLKACPVLRGRFKTTRIRRCHFFDSLIRAAWDTSLRLGDLLQIDVASVEADRFLWNQHKTGHNVDCVLTPSTLAAIEATFDNFAPSRKIIWPMWARREQFYPLFRRIVAEAELTGTFKKLRRSSITNVEAQGGPGYIQAGHTSPATTARWYLNRALAYENRPRPQELPKFANRNRRA